MKAPVLKLRCMACGSPLVGEFSIWSLSQDVDRAFVACLKCEPRLDRPNVLRVAAVKRKEPRV
jgi:hypothetical protein